MTMTTEQIAAMWRNDARAERSRAAGAATQAGKFARHARADTLEKCARELELHTAQAPSFEPGQLIEYVSHQTGLNATRGWTPGVFVRNLGAGGDSKYVAVRQLYWALRAERGETIGGYVQARRDEVRAIDPELISSARGWVADCQWIEDAEDIADLTDAQVVAGIQKHYTGGWVAFREAEDPSPGVPWSFPAMAYVFTQGHELVDAVLVYSAEQWAGLVAKHTGEGGHGWYVSATEPEASARRRLRS